MMEVLSSNPSAGVNESIASVTICTSKRKDKKLKKNNKEHKVHNKTTFLLFLEILMKDKALH